MVAFGVERCIFLVVMGVFDRLLAIAAGVAAFSTSVEGEDYRAFTNESGKVIEGMLVGENEAGDVVDLLRKDGKLFRLPVASLSKEDQAYAKRWRVAARAPLFEFTGYDWKDKETSHFRIRTRATSSSPAVPWAERTWELCETFMPLLRADFEKRGFRAPGEGINLNDFASRDGQFRFDLYLLGLPRDFRALSSQHMARPREENLGESWERMSREVGTFADEAHRYRVHVKVSGDVEEDSLERGENESVIIQASGSKHKFVHVLAVDLLGIQTRRHFRDFWVSAGLGWWAEHQLFQRCTVQYIDLEKHYVMERREGGGELRRSEILDAARSWVRPVKAMHANGKRQTIRDVMLVNVSNLTPRLGGYVFAWHQFLLSSDAMRKGYGKMIQRWRDGEDVDAGTLPGLFGFRDEGAMQEAWYDYIESGEFE